MKTIPFSGMLCNPMDVQKDGDFRIKGVINVPNDTHPPIIRYENFPSTEERDKRYNAILNLLRNDI